MSVSGLKTCCHVNSVLQVGARLWRKMKRESVLWKNTVISHCESRIENILSLIST